jgi:hypothetical protein
MIHVVYVTRLHSPIFVREFHTLNIKLFFKPTTKLIKNISHIVKTSWLYSILNLCQMLEENLSFSYRWNYRSIWRDQGRRLDVDGRMLYYILFLVIVAQKHDLP